MLPANKRLKYIWSIVKADQSSACWLVSGVYSDWLSSLVKYNSNWLMFSTFYYNSRFHSLFVRWWVVSPVNEVNTNILHITYISTSQVTMCVVLRLHTNEPIITKIPYKINVLWKLFTNNYISEILKQQTCSKSQQK